MSDLSPEQARLDPYSSLAENTNLTVQENITDLHTVIKNAKIGMLVTRDANGNLHSRAMTPATPYSDTQLNLVFLANNVSHKFEEIENDAHVNVSFCDPSSTDWASYSGRARVTQDKDLINKHWSSMITGYIGDLKDGIHKGDKNDPRVAVIEVIPDEIKFWITKHSSAVRTAQVAYGAATGKATSPGELRIISKEEIQLAQGLQSK
ncbi:uncharacterized protein BJ212DRAFT_211077 [Suillus subaureus]|uniref:General stress protein FMN-binding split barrel domain-containing protein n=1 Tax=Suillus subaureus TaxID=48587 RepID=A0A9P7EAV1_9AGAM|nr:uncharacterized protein BJ212DRAFT_211077 [Suillus subaureus]KAG1816093.1 hypothetical protein BJ212DRAFT_211077 [Suillus subaureus]